MRQEIWLSDLTQCEPADVVSRDRQEGTWIAVDYEVDEGKGLMLFGLPELNPPLLTLRLDSYEMGREFSNPSDG